MTSEALIPQAAYGCLAFDVFLMERWNHAADPSKDPEQWESAVRAYLTLTPRQRFPFHERAHRVADQYHSSHHTPVLIHPELAARLFTPYQTTRERNLTSVRARTDNPDPVWLCTCTGESRANFEAAYAALLAPVIGNGLVNAVLDDVKLYGCYDGGDWSRVLVRIPELCDVIRYPSEEVYEEMQSELEELFEEGCTEMEKLDMTVVTRVYLVDAEALEEELVKVLWLDCHGECVWHNTIKADDILHLTGGCHVWSVTEILNFAESMEKGARLLM